jgi:hypothetical protein
VDGQEQSDPMLGWCGLCSSISQREGRKGRKGSLLVSSHDIPGSPSGDGGGSGAVVSVLARVAASELAAG